jgi:hypothetical protein
MLLTECGSGTTLNCPLWVNTTIELKNVTITSDNEGTLVSWHIPLDDDSVVIVGRSYILFELNRSVKSQKGAVFGLCHYCIRRAMCPFEWEDNENDELQSTYKAVVVACFKVCACIQLHALRKITKNLGQGLQCPDIEPNSVPSIMKQACYQLNLQIWLPGTQGRIRTRKDYKFVCKVQIDW